MYTNNMNRLEFIGAQESDIPAVEDILNDATQYKVKHGDVAWGTEGWTDEEVRESMSESSVYLIRQGKEIVGTVSLQWEDERNWGIQPPVAGYMHRLAIKEGFHNLGLGAQAIDWALSQVAKKGRQYLRLDCEAKNAELCGYYEAQGFTHVGTRPVPEYGTYVAALYERPVNPDN